MKNEPIDYANISRCIYSSPEVASVGITEQEAKEQGYRRKSREISV